jgi:hypothetical protein
MTSRCLLRVTKQSHSVEVSWWVAVIMLPDKYLIIRLLHLRHVKRSWLHTTLTLLALVCPQRSSGLHIIVSSILRTYSHNKLYTWERPTRCTYLLTAWRKVLLEKLTGLQLVKKFPAFYGTRQFITSFTSARHLSISSASSIQSIPPHPNFWRSILIIRRLTTYIYVATHR